MLDLNVKQLSMLKNALDYYEENHWEMEDDKWQDEINDLRDIVRVELNKKKGQ